MGEGRTDVGPFEELIGERLRLLVHAPEPGRRVHRAGERVLTDRGDVRVEEQANRELDVLVLELELVVLLDDVHQVATGLHRPEDLRPQLAGLEEER